MRINAIPTSTSYAHGGGAAAGRTHSSLAGNPANPYSLGGKFHARTSKFGNVSSLKDSIKELDLESTRARKIVKGAKFCLQDPNKSARCIAELNENRMGAREIVDGAGFHRALRQFDHDRPIVSRFAAVASVAALATVIGTLCGISVDALAHLSDRKNDNAGRLFGTLVGCVVALTHGIMLFGVPRRLEMAMRAGDFRYDSKTPAGMALRLIESASLPLAKALHRNAESNLGKPHLLVKVQTVDTLRAVNHAVLHGWKRPQFDAHFFVDKNAPPDYVPAHLMQCDIPALGLRKGEYVVPKFQSFNHLLERDFGSYWDHPTKSLNSFLAACKSALGNKTEDRDGKSIANAAKSAESKDDPKGEQPRSTAQTANTSESDRPDGGASTSPSGEGENPTTPTDAPNGEPAAPRRPDVKAATPPAGQAATPTADQAATPTADHAATPPAGQAATAPAGQAAPAPADHAAKSEPTVASGGPNTKPPKPAVENLPEQPIGALQATEADMQLIRNALGHFLGETYEHAMVEDDVVATLCKYFRNTNSAMHHQAYASFEMREHDAYMRLSQVFRELMPQDENLLKSWARIDEACKVGGLFTGLRPAGMHTFFRNLEDSIVRAFSSFADPNMQGQNAGMSAPMYLPMMVLGSTVTVLLLGMSASPAAPLPLPDDGLNTLKKQMPAVQKAAHTVVVAPVQNASPASASPASMPGPSAQSNVNATAAPSGFSSYLTNPSTPITSLAA